MRKTTRFEGRQGVGDGESIAAGEPFEIAPDGDGLETIPAARGLAK